MNDRFADLPYWPAAMPLKHAALYCGLSPDTFKLRCPVKPIRLGESSRGDRYQAFVAELLAMVIMPGASKLEALHRMDDSFKTTGGAAVQVERGRLVKVARDDRVAGRDEVMRHLLH